MQSHKHFNIRIRIDIAVLIISRISTIYYLAGGWGIKNERETM